MASENKSSGEGGGASEGGRGQKPPTFSANREFTEGPASQTVLSMSQALLGPLDALSKAQLHAARSFLNFLMQLGYPHQPVPPQAGATEGSGSPPTKSGEDGGRGGDGGSSGDDGTGKKSQGESDGNEPGNDFIPYHMDFFHEVDKKWQRIRIPTLALVPVTPLGISEAQLKFDFYVKEIARHSQIRAGEKQKTTLERNQSTAEDPCDSSTRPWFLVETPVSLRGSFAPSPAESKDTTYQRMDEARFHFEVKVAAMPIPAALEKLLTGLAQVSTISENSPPKTTPPASSKAGGTES